MQMRSLSGFADREVIKAVAPVTKDKEAWEAFLAILEHEEMKQFYKLRGAPTTEQLHQIAGAVNLLHSMKKLRDNMLASEKEFLNGDDYSRP